MYLIPTYCAKVVQQYINDQIETIYLFEQVNEYSYDIFGENFGRNIMIIPILHNVVLLLLNYLSNQ